VIPTVIVVCGMATGYMAEVGERDVGRFLETPRPLPTMRTNDVSEREKSEQLLKEIERRVAEYERSGRDPTEAKKMREELEKLRESSKKLDQMIRDLADQSRKNADRK
jgi:DUF4097 and DUF4098 domain-containing protein YvlB